MTRSESDEALLAECTIETCGSGDEPTDDPCVQTIAAAADLVTKRDRWLNPEGASEAERFPGRMEESAEPA